MDGARCLSGAAVAGREGVPTVVEEEADQVAAVADRGSEELTPARGLDCTHPRPNRTAAAAAVVDKDEDNCYHDPGQ